MSTNILRQLDYSIYSDKERADYVKKILNESNIDKQDMDLDNNERLTKQLEGLANYILYGKNPEKSMNLVQQKKIEIKSRYSSYKRKNDESLEELLERPSFDESELREYTEKNSYSKPKQSVKHIKYDPNTFKVLDYGDSNIPGMVELWSSIEKLERKVALYNGTETPEEGEEKPKWDSYAEFKVKHWIIDLKKHQYYLKDSFAPVIPPHHSFPQYSSINWESDSKYMVTLPYREIIGKEEYELCEGEKIPDDISVEVKCWKIVRKHTIDLENPTHLYWLFEHYDALKKSSWDDLNGQMKYILFTLEQIGERANLSDVYSDILDLRIIKWSNQRIQQYILDKYGINYNTNYISTIYKKNICNKIAKTATIMRKEWENRDNPRAWKVCSCCGKTFLRDTYYFVKKTDSKDSFAARCKICDKKVRRGEKTYG